MLIKIAFMLLDVIYSVLLFLLNILYFFKNLPNILKDHWLKIFYILFNQYCKPDGL